MNQADFFTDNHIQQKYLCCYGNRRYVESEMRNSNQLRRIQLPKVSNVRGVLCGHSSQSSAWWRHQMDTFSALLPLCEGNPPVTDLRRNCTHHDITVMKFLFIKPGLRCFIYISAREMRIITSLSCNNLYSSILIIIILDHKKEICHIIFSCI